MPRKAVSLVRRWSLASAGGHRAGLWLTGGALAAAVHLILANAPRRHRGLPAPAWLPWPRGSLLPLPAAPKGSR